MHVSSFILKNSLINSKYEVQESFLKELKKVIKKIIKREELDINLDENADYKVCIYEDASKLIYNDESLEKALPKPWESEKNIWLFLQDHQGPKWRKLIRKNHRIQEVWNQRTMLTVPL